MSHRGLQVLGSGHQRQPEQSRSALRVTHARRNTGPIGFRRSRAARVPLIADPGGARQHPSSAAMSEHISAWARSVYPPSSALIYCHPDVSRRLRWRPSCGRISARRSNLDGDSGSSQMPIGNRTSPGSCKRQYFGRWREDQRITADFVDGSQVLAAPEHVDRRGC